MKIRRPVGQTNNMLQANYQRLFHHGVAYQVSYIWSKPMHTGGEWGPMVMSIQVPITSILR